MGNFNKKTILGIFFLLFYYGNADKYWTKLEVVVDSVTDAAGIDGMTSKIRCAVYAAIKNPMNNLACYDGSSRCQVASTDLTAASGTQSAGWTCYTSPINCPPTFVVVGSMCIRIEQSSKNRDASIAYCTSLGAVLFSPTTYAGYTAVTDYITAQGITGQLWNDIELINGKWIFVKAGRETTEGMNEWNSGTPNNAGQYTYALMRPTKLDDTPAHFGGFPICQIWGY